MILTKNKLAEMLTKNYMLNGYVNIIKDNERDAFFIVYPYAMVRIQLFTTSGWSCALYGEIGYAQAKGIIKIIDKLDNECYTLRSSK